MLTLYNKEDNQITFRGLEPGAPPLNIYSLVRNFYQQLSYKQVSADLIPTYEREFYASVLQYQDIWDQEERKKGVTATIVDRRINGQGIPSPALEMEGLVPYRIRGKLVKYARRTKISAK